MLKKRILAIPVIVGVLALGGAGLAIAATTAPAYWVCVKDGVVYGAIAKGACPWGTTGVLINSQGPAGARGARGARGAIGARGARGHRGLAGARGATGARGPAGARGLTGATGKTGARGAKGATGAPGNTTFTNYHATITTAGASSTTPAIVTLATIGPFTVTGECFITTGTTVHAETYVTTSQNHSALDDYSKAGEVADFNSTSGALQIGATASGSPGSPGFYGPNDGSTALESGDGTLFVNLFTGVGTYVGSAGGATEPACTFFGYYDSY